MKYKLPNGKTVNIPDEEIDNLVDRLDIYIAEAVECWLEDKDKIEMSEETKELNEKAKESKVDHGIAYKKADKKAPKPKVVTNSKKELFQTIWAAVEAQYGEKAKITTDNKYIDIESGGYTYTINLVEHRKPKK